jgi:hypothetical protein
MDTHTASDRLAVLWRRCARQPLDPMARAELRVWFTQDDADWPFTFGRICQHLRIDPEAVRGFVGIPDLRRAA